MLSVHFYFLVCISEVWAEETSLVSCLCFGKTPHSSTVSGCDSASWVLARTRSCHVLVLLYGKWSVGSLRLKSKISVPHEGRKQNRSKSHLCPYQGLLFAFLLKTCHVAEGTFPILPKLGSLCWWHQRCGRRGSVGATKLSLELCLPGWNTSLR